jgi:hypothetical protein
MKILYIATLTIITLTLYSQENEITQTDYKELKCGLYLNNSGDIGYKTSVLIDDNMGNNHGVSYREWGYIMDEDNTLALDGSIVELKNIIDTNTFQILNNYYCKDKNYVYAIFYTSSGATFNITKNIDPLTFKCINFSSYGFDKNYVYFRTDTIKEADVKSFKVISDDPFGAYDKFNYYNYGEIISLKEAKKRRYPTRKK